MDNKFEKITSYEAKEEKTSIVALDCFRHAEVNRDSRKTNKEFELSSIGRKQAIEKSKEVDIKNPEKARSFGSPRWRSMQTAGFALAGRNINEINGEESFKELQEKLNKEESAILKLDAKPKLDFYLDKSSPFGKEAHEAVFIKHDYLKFLVEKSDALALENNDKKASTYSGHGKDIAEIVKVYASVGNKWNKLIKGGKYENPNLERCLCSHGGVFESFLLKVIEKIKGTKERDRLLDIMPHQFDYTEGFKITIINKGSNQKIHILFKKDDKNNPKNNFIFDEDIPLNVLDEIIEEGGVILKKLKNE